MSTRWETLAGDTSRFAVKMSFIADSSEVPVVPDLAASWGSLELWVHGANLCAHVEEGETVEGVHWYLLPLLEWLAANWNPMLHEERLPISNSGEDAVTSLYRTRFPPAQLSKEQALEHDEQWYAWRERHALHAARDGGLFPELYLRRREDKVELSWSNHPPPGSPFGFSFLVPYGRALFRPEDVARPLYEVARAAVEQLRDWQPSSERVARLLTTVRELDDPARQRPARLDWLFDLKIAGTPAVPPREAVQRLFAPTASKVRRAILEPPETGLVLRGSSHAVLLFGSVSPTVSASDAQALANLLTTQFDEAGDPAELAELVTEAESAPRDGLPWEQGYELADLAHEALALPGDGKVDIEAVLERLDVDVGALTLSDRRLRGVAVAGPQHRPAVIHNGSHPRNRSPEGHRFTLAHELCHLLIDRRAGRKLAIASGPWAPVDVERRANAFAAYFLMPPERLHAVVSTLTEPLASVSSIRQVAAALQTSSRATLEHLYNLGFLDEFERDELGGTSLDDRAFDRPATEVGG